MKCEIDKIPYELYSYCVESAKQDINNNNNNLGLVNGFAICH